MDRFKFENYCRNKNNGLNECWTCFNNSKTSVLFKTQCDLVKHLRFEHLNEKPFRCSICNDVYFNDLDSVKSHILKHSPNDDQSKNSFMFACAICEQIYTDFDSILEHFIQSSACNLNAQFSNDQCFTCAYCGDAHLNENVFNVHLDQHKYLLAFEEPAVIVRKTPIFTNNKANLKSNLKNINLSSNNKKYCIDALLNSKSVKKETKLLENSSSIINQFKNTEKTKMSNSAFVIPIKSSQKSEDDKTEKTCRLFSNSIFHYNAIEQTKLKCDNCGFLFSSILDLNKHKQLHNSMNMKRPYKCHLCQVTFSKVDQLSRHMIVHQATDQDSVCQICYSSFSRKQDLDRHMLFHSK